MSLTLENAAAIAALNGILAKLADPIPYFVYVGAQEKHVIQERITHTKLDPENRPWAPWAEFTDIKRHLKGNTGQGIMWDTGELLNSIRYDIDGTFGLDIGTDVWYAQQHQEGRDRLPIREILGWEVDLLPHYAQAFVNYLEGAKL